MKGLIITGLFICAFLLGCIGENAQTGVSNSITEKTDRYVISKVGEDFFSKYITLNSNLSRYNPPDELCIQNPGSCAPYLEKSNYYIVYSFKIPEKPYVDELIELTVDGEGNVIEAWGVPDCIINPNECDFPIDEAEARQLAKNAGLEEGMADWELSFHWYGGNLSTYVWTVQNTLSEHPSGEPYLASGRVVVIDANSGGIKEISDWVTIS